jgi:hypothetical protein
VLIRAISLQVIDLDNSGTGLRLKLGLVRIQKEDATKSQSHHDKHGYDERCK